MKKNDFRRIVLGLKDAAEGTHMNHPDFRVNGKIFATLHHGELEGMVKLTPEQQEEFIVEDPKTFSPEAGAWGRAGCTRVVLATANEDTLGRALTLARQNVLDQMKKPAKPAKRQA
jgi:YjbR